MGLFFPAHSLRTTSRPEVIDIFEFDHIPKFKDKFFLTEKYVKEGLSPAQIATQIFSGRGTVTKYLRVLGIPLRKEDEPKVKTVNQLKFGERLWRNKVAKQKKERAVLNTIRKLRARHYSYHQIARFLNDSGVPTKTGRGRWHARFVKKLLDRDKK